MKEHGLIYTVIFTFLVCFVFVFVLALTNVATATQVQLNEMLTQQRAILRAMDIEFKSDQEVQRLFDAIGIQEVGQEQVYVGERNGESVIALRFSGPGLWGTIHGVLALNEKGDRIVGLDIISHNETPGLGARIDEPWYKTQFNGELIGPDGTITMVSRRGIGDPDPENSEIDGVTGATRTSQAILRILNTEIEKFQGIIDKIGGKS